MIELCNSNYNLHLDLCIGVQDTSELFFDDVRLPKSALLGKLNGGFYQLMKELPQERLLIAILGMASCEWMFEETRAYVKQRKAFGKTISALQVCPSVVSRTYLKLLYISLFISNLQLLKNN